MTQRPKIVVLDGHTLNPGDNPWDGLAAVGDLTVHDRTPAAEIVARADGADIVITNKTPLSAATFERLPACRAVAVLATGFDVVDLKAARARGIPVSNVPEYGTDSVAQFVFAQLLQLCHRIADHDAAVRQGEWARRGEFSFWLASPIELAGLTLGIVGLGRIGRRVAEIARAFGMQVIAADANPAAAAPGVTMMPVPELFAQADVVTLHCPLTPENRGFVNAGLLAGMKPGAFLINASRGPLVDEAALAAALRTGRLGGAALDVVSVEPIDPANPVLEAPNCIITPHIAWATLAARRRIMATTVENVRAFLAGAPKNVVN